MIRVILLLFAVTAFGDTYPRQTGVDVQHYLFRIGLTDANDEISGETTVTVKFVADGVSAFALDLAPTMNVTAVEPAASYTHTGARLNIKLSAGSKSGELKKLTIRYHGVPSSGLRMGLNKYGERTFFSSNWPDKARQWLPLIDHPYDKATSEFIVTAPVKYQVVSNGLLQETTDVGKGNRLTHWKQSIPIASWLNTIGVAQFASRDFGMVKGTPLQTWVFPQDRELGIATFEVPTAQTMEFYSDAIGPYPYEKLANVEAAGVNGGMELASAIFYGDRTLSNSPAYGIVSHEIAHQWFGDSVTEKDWDDVWLSEGFATYFALLTREHYQGRDGFVDGLKNSRERAFAAEEKNPGVAVRHNNLADMSKVLNQVVYQKGGWTLHMLRNEMGTDAFWLGIREYYRRYRDSNASSDDLRKVMEEVSGKDLGWFFEQWLNRPGSPVVKGSWRYDPTTKLIVVELSQTQAGDAYKLPVDIGFSGRVEKLRMTGKQQRFEVHADAEPADVMLDPNTTTLMHATFVKH